MMSFTSKARGFTLLELLIAVALMAVLSIMSWRGLQSVLGARDRITESANEIRALSTAFTQLDQDLRRSWPVRLYPTARRPIVFMKPAGDDKSPMMVVIRESTASESVEIQQVVYRLRADVFERGFSPWQSTGIDASIRLDELIWQPLVNRVESLSFRAWVPKKGWISGRELFDLAVAPRPKQVGKAPVPDYDGPTGVELLMARNGHDLKRLFAVED